MKQKWTDAGELTARGLGGLVRIMGDTHAAVSRRVDTFLPPAAKPYNDLHADIAASVYLAVGGAQEHASRLAFGVAARSGGDPTTTRAGSIAQRIVNGFHGDLVAAEHPSWAVPMALRIDGRDARPAEFRDGTPRVVVFVHGLAEDERAWSLGGRAPYGDRLRDDGYTAVYVRYNSGQHISTNGRALSDLLDELVRDWAVPVESIDLVGHSMGGLVSRSACHVGGDWTTRVRTVVTLGSPHRGAPLEKAVHVIDAVMRRIPEAEPLGRVLAHRSAGVKDLRYGSLVDSDWEGHDVDAFLARRAAEVPFLSHARYYWVAATVTRDARHPVGRLVGDGMVRLPSASAVAGEGIHIADLGHLGLLNDEAVFQALRGWLHAFVDERS